MKSIIRLCMSGIIVGLPLYFSAQNVGIGTTTPTEKLDINGDLIVQGQDIYVAHDAATNTDNDYMSYNDAAPTALEGSGIFHFHSDEARAGTWQLPSASISAQGAYFSGRVGIGTTNPDQLLELNNGGMQINGEFGIGFNGAPPFDANVSYDRAKIYFDIHFQGTNNSDFLVFEKTDYNHSDPDGGFVFATKGSDNVQEVALTIRGNKRLGLQTITNPAYALELPNSTTVSVGQARANAWATYSDGRLKDARKTIPYGLQTVLQLKPLAYQHHHSDTDLEGNIKISATSTPTIGFIAQELQVLIPEAVYIPSNEAKDLWAVDYTRLIPVLTKAIQEQQTTIQELQEKYKAIKNLEQKYILLQEQCLSLQKELDQR
ncbi:tail fiber domain-containing protein [Aureispira anguillae]|uniref:Tail fiber domain-containing protein n=1 Tax=Aureispira anguillae TaxID=2864201 RepID=A0A915YLF9_9BACT|nr:tail fiber domain-containing protein [Aureispira anguillae]BDS15293.1 tail fiber domain-containing protein [Aureispira anguillae]